MSDTYSAIPVRFSGRIVYRIKADSEEDAMKKANEMAEEADCGELEDIDWETKPSIESYCEPSGPY